MRDTSFPAYARFTAKQELVWDAMRSRPTVRILAGGSGFGGKSFALRACAVGFHMLLAKWGVPRPTTVFSSSSYEALRDRHYTKFAEEWGHLGEVRTSHGVYGRCFLFHERALGAIAFRNLANPDERRGSEYCAGFLDELTEVQRAIFGAFCYMVRRPGIPFRPVVTASNPDGIGHAFAKALWRPTLYDQRTGECLNLDARLAPYPANVSATGMDNPEDYIYIPFMPDDNPAFVEEDFWAGVAHLPPHIQRARRWGLWDSPEGARWPNLNDEEHIFSAADQFPRGIPQTWKRLIGIDYGLRSPYAATWHAIDYDSNIWTYREDYKAGLTADVQAQRVLDLTGRDESISGVYLDPSMWAVLPGHQGRTHISTADMYRNAIHADPRFPSGILPGDNRHRIHSLNTLDKFLNRGNQYPLWRIEQGCVNLWAELTGAVFQQGTELQQLSEDIDPRCPDHAIDATRYALHTWFRPPDAPPQPPRPPSPEELAVARHGQLERESLREFKRATKTRRL